MSHCRQCGEGFLAPARRIFYLSSSRKHVRSIWNAAPLESVLDDTLRSERFLFVGMGNISAVP
ncbi:MAG: hypothetical protein WCU00_00800 [Candidatus Latescibacterota bacterium]